MGLSVAQCRAARALLGWSASDLAAAAEISAITVKRLEGGRLVSAASEQTIIATFTKAGIVFINAGNTSSNGGDGVRFAASLPD
ncbi:XRE family transcriptional regulator [Sphingomonas endolithica]|uniref:XRE family transcriptional regulator n=1 Tax=Sphingomonas endolithica TaxID=2972485 RepID=UPI0021AEC864|nr:XRE family transcriptional regulator [Sphingomonas sp. ZFBP2030]